jgi:hypothetical protein
MKPSHLCLRLPNDFSFHVLRLRMFHEFLSYTCVLNVLTSHPPWCVHPGNICRCVPIVNLLIMLSFHLSYFEMCDWEVCKARFMKIQNNRLISKYGSLYISFSVISMDCKCAFHFSYLQSNHKHPIGNHKKYRFHEALLNKHFSCLCITSPFNL